MHFLVIYIFRNCMFVCNSMGNGPVEGAIASILKHLKGYYSKTQLNFLLFLQKMSHYYPRTKSSWSHWGPSTSMYKSPLSPCNYTTGDRFRDLHMEKFLHSESKSYTELVAFHWKEYEVKNRCCCFIFFSYDV